MNRLAAALLLLVPVTALAAGALNLDQVAGVYKDRFANELVDGSKFTSENILEVVKVTPTRAYVRAHLEFYNGHQCAFAQVMAVQGDILVYKGPNDQGAACEMKLHFTKGKVTFEDHDGHCREESCGMRGGYDGIDFAASARRPIRYMPRLLASQEYRDAVKERAKN